MSGGGGAGAPAGRVSLSLPWLFTSGNRIFRSDTNVPIWLRGVNRSGLEYAEPGEQGFLAAAGISQLEIQEIAVNWNANVIRLPFNQAWALDWCGAQTAEDYLAALDQVIAWAAEYGTYTLLDLQWLDRNTVYGRLPDGSENHVAPLPNSDSIRLWRLLAQRYREEPAVLFDLFNEPHDPLEDDREPLFLIDSDGGPVEAEADFAMADAWRAWANVLVNAIRGVHPRSLIFVSGVDWGYDLRDIYVDAPNIVYATHVYPNRDPKGWDHHFGRIARRSPVFAAEWGGEDCDLAWGRRLAEYLRDLGIGWTAWSWSDRPCLLASGMPGCTASQFGALVREELLK